MTPTKIASVCGARAFGSENMIEVSVRFYSGLELRITVDGEYPDCEDGIMEVYDNLSDLPDLDNYCEGVLGRAINAARAFASYVLRD